MDVVWFLFKCGLVLVWWVVSTSLINIFIPVDYLFAGVLFLIWFVIAIILSR